MPHHAQNECKIFRDAQVPPCVLKPYQYDFINFLRSLLLGEHGAVVGENNTESSSSSLSKQSWEEILALESHAEARAGNPFANRLVFETIEFILKTCKLEGRFEPKVIDHVVGVWTINSFGANPPAGVKPGYARMATLLFPKLCLAAHNCIPNTHGVLKEDIKDGKPTYTMELIASLAIPEGGQIHTTYANVCEGTMERREVLQDHYFFSCVCKRCSDPTEFGTYFSSLKCQDCTSGFLLSENPLDNSASWTCTEKCEESRKDKKYSEFIPKINRIRKEVNAAEMEYRVEDCIEKYTEILETYKGKVLHPNHWLVIDTEFKLMLRIASYLTPTSRAKKEEQGELLRKLIELAQHCLRVADVIQPGLNSYRGELI
ncbi:Protein msta, isoform A [Orchesella cincta]|uniref:Protein msta, isoform A n=1 Tax=Orchesella cincta TaxID=48709 RepID=A0A1D2N0L6_ORCCI|nr:Protein msta, isoform A [Orchesella cincta]